MSLVSIPRSPEILEPRWAPARLFGDLLPPALGADLTELPAEFEGLVDFLLSEPSQKTRSRPIISVDEVIDGGGDASDSGNTDEDGDTEATGVSIPTYSGGTLSLYGGSISMFASASFSAIPNIYSSGGVVKISAGVLVLSSTIGMQASLAGGSLFALPEYSLPALSIVPNVVSEDPTADGRFSSNIARYLSISGAALTLPNAGVLSGGIALTSVSSNSFPAGILDGLVAPDGTVLLANF